MHKLFCIEFYFFVTDIKQKNAYQRLCIYFQDLSQLFIIKRSRNICFNSFITDIKKTFYLM